MLRVETLLVVVLALGACTPEPGVRQPPPETSAANPGVAVGPVGNAVWAARTATYADMAALVLEPAGALARTRPRHEPDKFTLEDKIFVRRALIDVADPASDGSRRFSIVARWEDALGRSEDEMREGVLVNGPKGVEVRWTRVVTWPGSSGDERLEGPERLR
jgi:hypothetical protein